jgi:hypothetical protein
MLQSDGFELVTRVAIFTVVEGHVLLTIELLTVGVAGNEFIVIVAFPFIFTEHPVLAFVAVTVYVPADI